MEGNDPMAPEGNLFRDPHVKTGGKKRTQKNSRKTTRNAKKKGTQDLEFAQNWFRIQKKKMNQSCGRKPNGNRGQRPIKSMRRRWQGWGGRGGGGGGDEATAMREGGMTKVKEWVFFFFFCSFGRRCDACKPGSVTRGTLWFLHSQNNFFFFSSNFPSKSIFFFTHLVCIV